MGNPAIYCRNGWKKRAASNRFAFIAQMGSHATSICDLRKFASFTPGGDRPDPDENCYEPVAVIGTRLSSCPELARTIADLALALHYRPRMLKM